MSENTFSGLCIGGPWDGKSRTHWSSQIELMTVFGGDHRESVYDFCPLTDKQGVWVHESMRQEGRGLASVAINAMALAYVTNPRAPTE